MANHGDYLTAKGSVLEKWIYERQKKTNVRIGLAFKDLSVHGFISSSQYQHTVASYLLIVPRYFLSLYSQKKRKKVQILQNFSGLMHPGEMLLVLGRPGSGCSTFLKALAGDTHGIYIGGENSINYEGTPYQQMHRKFKGHSIYLAELDVHFPELTLRETLSFAAATQEGDHRRTSISRANGRNVASLFSLEEALDTKMGDAIIRGVSGGEKKRVSLAEAFMSGSQIQCWDNSTRGLDSSTALDFIKLLRSTTTGCGSTVFMSIYQTSEAMYTNFDKVTLLYDGLQIYFGPASDAVEYFIKLGFVRPKRTTTADFLTSLTHPAERIVRDGYEARVPRSAYEFASAWRRSQQAVRLGEETDVFNAHHPCYHNFVKSGTDGSSAAMEVAKLPSSTYQIPVYLQITSCVRRGMLRLKNNYPPVVAGIVGNTIVAIVIGSVFYQLEESTESLGKRAVLLFFAIMINALTPAFEVLTIWAQRPIVEKHDRYMFYHPFTENCAAIICDLPNKVATSLTFNIALYFMTNLRRTPESFFIYYLFSFVTMMAMSMFFRMVGSISRTSAQTMAPVSIMVLIFVTYTGFIVPFDHMTTWLRWLRWLNPFAYAYESLMINEFHDRDFFCSAMVPAGPRYDALGLQGKICPVVGASPGDRLVKGSAYIELKFSYTSDHLWRNLVILIAMMIVFCVVQLLAAEFIPSQRSMGEVLLFRRNHMRRRGMTSDGEEKTQVFFSKDVQLMAMNRDTELSGKNDTLHIEKEIQIPSALFHWENVNYTIKTSGGVREILSNVEGWVKPGTLTALMGATGAGKTSLLDVLAARASAGTVIGNVLVNGTLRDKSFQRRIGYVQQEDIHLATSTVREALEFSALLRRPKDISKREKLDYVASVISMLDMDSYADAIVGIPGEGLNVEQRKRLTIAVEMVAKPELLLFLDEPTSGMDSQTAWSICMLLRKLADNGQAILCTIHQPSSQLFQIFDRLLLLEKGGKTLYFGDIGQHASAMVNYFTRNGAPNCTPDENPAEWVLKMTTDIASEKTSADHVKDQQWSQIWKNSSERRKIQEHLKFLKASRPASTHESLTIPGDEYATTFIQQFTTVLARILQEYWRDPVYLYSKVALSAGVAFCTGLSFFMTRLDMQGVQNIFFSAFVLTQLFSTVDQQIIPRLTSERGLFEARERRSKSYSWVVFVSANIIVELFWQTLTSILVFAAWYFPTGLWRNGDPEFTATARGGLTFTILWLFCMFISTFSQAVAIGMEFAETAVQIATLFFYLCLIFCGVIVRPADLPNFWIFMHRVSPLTYFIGGIVTAGLANTSITCSTTEVLHIEPPTGQNCGGYLSDYIQSAGGYLSNANATSDCHYCPVAGANTILEYYGIDVGARWLNAAYMVVYVIVNILATFAIYWAARVPRFRKEAS